MKTGKTIGILTAFANKLPNARPELLQKLIEDDNKIVVFGLESKEDGDNAFSSLGIPYVHIPLDRHSLNIFKERKAIKVIEKALKDNHIDELLTYGIRLVISANRACHRVGIAPVNVINGAGTLFVLRGLKGKLLRLGTTPLLKRSFSYAKKVIFQNPDDMNEFVERKLVNSAKTALINGSGVNLDKYSIQKINFNYSFGIACRLTVEKGIFDLINAFRIVQADHPNAKLYIAGAMDGLEKSPAIEAFKQAISCNGIVYFGEISDVASFLAQVDCFVYPSCYREGVPRAILEAMASGRPIITTNMPGCRETVIEGVNGYIVNPHDIEALAEKMIWMIEHPSEIEKMSVESRKLAEEKFDVYKINQVIIQNL